MKKKEHQYKVVVKWTGNKGEGTKDYRAYERSHTISVEGKEAILASADSAFRGDPTKFNPEELLLASVSSCHMLWFLHLCADNGITVIAYADEPIGTMIEYEKGGGRFSELTLSPKVTILQQDAMSRLDDLHSEANKLCFIANSLNFEVKHKSSAICAEI